MKPKLAILALVGAIALWVGCGSVPAGAEPSLPASVAAALAEHADLCAEVGGTPDTTDAVRSVDLNGDGALDFVLFVGWITCEGAVSIYGDRVKDVAVYAGDAAGGAARAFADRVYDVKIEGSGEAAKLWLTVAGDMCGKAPAPDFAHENFCERAIVWNGETKGFGYAPDSSVRLIQ